MINGDPDPPAPPALAVSEFLWDVPGTLPVAPFRFVEIHNTGDIPVDLSAGVQLYGNATFDFESSDIPTLDPGKYVLAVADIDSFRGNWGLGFPIAGAFEHRNFFSFDRQFGLLAADGQKIEEFGFSAVPDFFFQTWERIDTAAPPMFPGNWRASSHEFGSPGEREVPIISLFGDFPIKVRAGATVNLGWQITGAKSVHLEPDLGTFPPGFGTAQVIIGPGEGSRTYSLVAMGEFATVTKPLPVLVAPEIRSFEATKASVSDSEPLRFEWDVFGASQITISPGGGNVTAQNGKAEFYPRDTDLISKESQWRYLDDGSDQADSWSDPGFDDSRWSEGIGIFGYGNDGIEQTITARGHVTNYFRKRFDIEDPAAFTALFVELLIDDGAQIFLNGTEILRENLPEGEINYLTPSLTPAPNDGRTYTRFQIDKSQLRTGENVIAVGAHNNRENSDDFGFDLRFLGVKPSELGYQSYTLRATNDAGFAEARVTVLFGQPSKTFEQWAAESGISGVRRAGDEDGDGLTNELEAALGWQPTIANQQNPLTIGVGDDGRIVLNYPSDLKTEAAGRLALQISRDGQTWLPGGGDLRFFESRSTDDGIANVLHTTVGIAGGQDSVLMFRLALIE